MRVRGVVRLAATSLIIVGSAQWSAADTPVASPIYLAGLSGGGHVFALDSNDKLLEKWSIDGWPLAFSGLAVGDLDGDGEDEVIVGHLQTIEIRDTAGVLRASVDRPAFFLQFLAAGDVDGDGRDEVISAEWRAGATGTIRIFDALTIPPTSSEFSTSPGNRGNWPAFLPISGLATGDVNGDGQDEILVVLFSTVPGISQDRVLIYDLNDIGTSIPIPTFDVGSFAQVASGDVDGNGVDEIVIVRPEHAVPPFGRREIFIYDASGTQLGPPIPTDASADPPFPFTDVAVGDVNHDGRDEILVGNGAGGGVIVYDGVRRTEIGRIGPSQSLTGPVAVAVGKHAYPDADGDGLLDNWERYGVAGLDLPGFGADSLHKDLFLELDSVYDPNHGLLGQRLTRADIQMLKAAFAAAPINAGGVANPDGQPGINLHVDTGSAGDPNASEDGAGPGTCSDGIDNGGDGFEDFLDFPGDHQDPDCLVGDNLGGGGCVVGEDGFCVRFDQPPPSGSPLPGCLDEAFYTLRDLNFDHEHRGLVFRYGVSGDGLHLVDQCGGGRAEVGGNDFIEFNHNAGTTMHELGHTLNLRDGGGDNMKCKPNYVSVMNYDHQSGINQNGGGKIIDYSPPRSAGGRGMAPLPMLAENALSEPFVLDASDATNQFIFVEASGQKVRSPLDQPVNWNGDIDPPFEAGPLTVNIDTAGVNGRPSSCRNDATDSTLTGFDDWRNISLRFRQFGDSADAAINPITHSEPTMLELLDLQRELNTTDLAITQVADPDPPTLGESFVYRLTVTNKGPNPADAVRVVDNLPPGAVYESDDAGCSLGAGGLLTCELGTLMASEVRTFEVRVTAKPVCELGLPKPVENVARVSNVVELAGPDLVPADNEAHLTVTPVDLAAPEVSVSLSPSILRPPDHKLKAVSATIMASDACDANPIVRLVFITSSEPDEGLGDGDTRGDIQGATFGTDDSAFELRAERSGRGTGRTYTVVYEAQDASGNTGAGQAQVLATDVKPGP